MSDRATRVAAAATAWGAQLRQVADCGSLTRTDSRAELDATDADPGALATLLSGGPVRLSSLVRDRAGHAAALRRVRALRDDIRRLWEQHGVAAGKFAIGMASWHGRAGEQRVAPVLLHPLRISARTASEDDFDFALGPANVNRALGEELLATYAVTLDLPRPATMPAGNAEPAEFYDQLRRQAAAVPGFTVRHRLVLGTYTDAATALSAELATAGELLAASPGIAFLAGDGAAAGELAPAGAEPTTAVGGLPDEIAPAEEYLALDADATASQAIDAVRAGGHLALEGAPGTGRTQTVVNMIAALVAASRSVLVLAENRLAAEKLLDRLGEAGLGGLALDAGGIAAGDPAAGRHAISPAVAAVDHPLPALPDLTALHARLTDRRDRLRRHAETLSSVREPWGVSVSAAQAALLGLPGEAASRIRFAPDILATLHGELLAEMRDAIAEWARLGGSTLTGLDTPWYGGRVASPTDAERARRLAAELATETYPSVRAAVVRTLAAAGLAPPASVAEWRTALDLLHAVAETEQLLSAEVWAAPLAELVAATAPAGGRREQAERSGWSDRVAARRAARRLWRGGKPVSGELHEALARARAQQVQWSASALHGGGAERRGPQVAPDLDAVEKSYAELLDGLAALEVFLPERNFARLAPAVLDKTLNSLATDPVLPRLPRLGELVARCTALGLRPFLLDLHSRRLAAELAPTAFTFVWLSSVLAAVAAADPAYAGFDSAALRETAAEYRRADREHIASTPTRLERRVREATAAAVRGHPEQAAAIRAAAERPAALRQLLTDAPDVALAAAPCWVLSPYAVPDVLPPQQLFDVVIVVAANAVSIPVAVPGLARGRQVVVVGDRRQLPPRGLGESLARLGGVLAGDQAAGSRQRPTSVLDALAPVLRRVTLPTYHRRTDERLVGFPAATVYGGRLRTTPGPDRRDPVRYVPVPHRSGTPGQEDSVTAEVQKVVGLVIDHAVHRPAESFGVVTLASRHAERIAAALRVALVGRPELGDVFRGDAAERFFISPCADLGSEERDSVLFSTGFGNTPDGRPSYRFGPLDADGGERLLTVGLTRARSSLTLVTSLSSSTLDPGRLPSTGARLLRALLRYAEEPELRRRPYAESAPPDGLDLDLRERLRAAGLPVVTDYGLGRFRIPLALAAPDDPDRLVLAVEIDGPRWAQEPTVRDRDRLAPERLAALGWSEIRLSAIDWFRNPAGEVARIRAGYQAALAQLR